MFEREHFTSGSHRELVQRWFSDGSARRFRNADARFGPSADSTIMHRMNQSEPNDLLQIEVCNVYLACQSALCNARILPLFQTCPRKRARSRRLFKAAQSCSKLLKAVQSSLEEQPLFRHFPALRRQLQVWQVVLSKS